MADGLGAALAVYEAAALIACYMLYVLFMVYNPQIMECVARACGDDLLTVSGAPHQVYGPRDNLFLPNLLEAGGNGLLRIFGAWTCNSADEKAKRDKAGRLMRRALLAHVAATFDGWRAR